MKKKKKKKKKTRTCHNNVTLKKDNRSSPTMFGGPRGAMVKEMDGGIVVKRVQTPVVPLCSLSQNTLGKGMDSLILPTMG